MTGLSLIFTIVLCLIATFIIAVLWRPPETSRRKNSNLSFSVRAINLLGKICLFFGIHLVKLDKQQLLKKALKQSGVASFTHNRYWEKPFDMAIKNTLDPKNEVSTFGFICFERFFSNGLINRLKMEKFLADNPSVEQYQVNPVIIAGLPRTGTTLLYSLMSRDPLCRAPRTWEMTTPFPPPTKDTYWNDPRIEVAKAAWAWMPKDFASAHYLDPAGPEEELVLFTYLFWFNCLGVWGKGYEDYREWIHDISDKRELYKDFKRFIQILSSSYPPGMPFTTTVNLSESHWCLKAPLHSRGRNFQCLLETFPNAKIIHCHRNLDVVVGSSCAIFKVYSYIFSETYDPMAIGKLTLYELSKGMENSIEYINSLPKKQVEEQIFDIPYERVMKDPIGSVKSIYQHFGLKFTPQFEENMKKWLAENPQGKHGRHSYSLEEYGLNSQEVKSKFAVYLEKYGKHIK